MLLFICLRCVFDICPDIVSIHLMLLFIWDSNVVRVRVRGFQYISCYSLSVNILILFLLSLCFNTSHVTLYQCAAYTVSWIHVVSIHLMLLFIFSKQYQEAQYLLFQYISCYSLSQHLPQKC